MLFSARLRDIFLKLADKKLYQPYWSAQILEECEGAWLRKGKLDAAKRQKILDTLQTYYPSAMVAGYARLIPQMKNQKGDRHVAAAAARAGAAVIVTDNLKDFSPLPGGIIAESPDDFLCRLLNLDGGACVEVITSHVAKLQQPSYALEDWLDKFAQSAPQFVKNLRQILLPKAPPR